MRLLAAVRPGGVLVIHEYLDYATWRLRPASSAFDCFVSEVMSSWRAAGGEPNIGLDLARWLADAGCAVTPKAIVEVIQPADFMWRWPASFVDVNLDRLVELGRVSADDAGVVRADMARAGASPTARMSTPVVLELIAHKPG